MERPGVTEPILQGSIAATKSSPSRVWRLAAVATLIVSITWVVWLLSSAWPVLLARRSQISLGWISLGVLAALVASLILFLSFVRIMRLLGSSRLRLREAGHLYFAAQLLKHVPGRVWGIGYQWALSREGHSFSAWLWANLVHLYFATYFALWFATVVVLARHSIVSAIGSLVLGAAGYVLAWHAITRAGSSEWKVLQRLLRGRFQAGIPSAFVRVDAREKLQIFVLLCASWAVFFSSWYANGLAYAELGGWGGVRMCAYYLMAWFVGYITLITPSGLGVRELVFVWLATDYGADAVALMAIVGRVSSLLVDVLLGLMFAPFAPPNGVTDGSG